jgi:phenylacetic acid degradation operon negative regulatory protein
MQWKSFHHPDLSAPVIRRRAGDELVTLLAGTAELLLSRGLSTLYCDCYPNRNAYHSAVTRLRKRGLITTESRKGELPSLKLTPAAATSLPLYYTPHKAWNRKWNNRWYILMFDVPEKNRPYRDHLRAFLKQNHFGCLQRSVWVTPRDVRPDYDDLNKAAAVDTVAFLFEAQTVLGFGPQSVVREAWNFQLIHQLQERYIQVAHENLLRLKNGPAQPGDLVTLLRAENQAYAQALSLDPLLPKELNPPGYLGLQVADCHKNLIHQTIEKL